jgi:hypothetical protein
MLEKINEILATWDPIGVGLPISREEYLSYAPQILKYLESEQLLRDYLIHLLDYLGLEYDASNRVQMESHNEVINKLLKLGASQ